MQGTSPMMNNQNMMNQNNPNMQGNSPMLNNPMNLNMMNQNYNTPMYFNQITRSYYPPSNSIPCSHGFYPFENIVHAVKTSQGQQPLITNEEAKTKYKDQLEQMKGMGLMD